MNKLTKLLIAVPAFLAALQVSAQDFDAAWAKADATAKAEPDLLYNCAVRPVWTGAKTFIYSVKEQGGQMAYYAVDVNSLGKTAMSKDEYDAAVKAAMPHGPAFFDDDVIHSRRDRAKAEIPSPDGRYKAYIKDNNVWMKDGDKEYQLSFDGAEGYPYQMIMWSPDSKKIAASRHQQIKERQILLRVSRPDDQVQPEYRWLDYAKPGDQVEQTQTALFDVENHSRICYSNAPYDNQYSLYLGQWSPNSDYFTFEYNQRGHQVYQLVAVDAKTGENRILADENTAKYPYKFIYYNEIYRYYFKDGRHILWGSERDGYRHLYMIDALTGEVEQLTKGEWNVREIHHVDEEGGFVIFSASGLDAKHEAGDVTPGTVSAAGKNGHGQGEDPYNKHVCKLDLNTLGLVDLTPENANHTAQFGREDCSYFVDNYSRPDMPNVTVVRSANDGSVIMKLHEQDITELLKTGFTMPEVFVAKGRDGVTDIWGTIWRPNNYNPKKKYPVVEYIYAGPHDNHVDKNFIAGANRNRKLNELGFIVVCIDGMGTDNRSRAFQDVCWQNLKDAGFPDRILWMQAAAKVYKSMDISNVGIYGYSAGGQNTLSALLFQPDFYKVGVALCGCHDNRMDKIWWNEQWMGYPIGPWYSESSNVDNAYRLQGKLFIINGEIDDNVDPASSLQVVSELIKAGKDFDQLYIPGYTHNLGADWITRRVFRYFYQNCK